MDKPAAFISHDSRDKQDIARPLAMKLTEMRCKVWFDEFSLKPGDSLRESIETGLKECRRCVLILTPNFLTNEGWTKTEFNSVFTREILEKRNLIIPIWAGVTKNQIFEYCPTILDRVGLMWTDGEETIAKRIAAVCFDESF